MENKPFGKQIHWKINSLENNPLKENKPIGKQIHWKTNSFENNPLRKNKLIRKQTYWKTKDGDSDATWSEIVLCVGPTIGALDPGDKKD